MCQEFKEKMADNFIKMNFPVFTLEKGIAGRKSANSINWNGVCEGENYVQRAP